MVIKSNYINVATNGKKNDNNYDSRIMYLVVKKKYG